MHHDNKQSEKRRMWGCSSWRWKHKDISKRQYNILTLSATYYVRDLNRNAVRRHIRTRFVSKTLQISAICLKEIDKA